MATPTRREIVAPAPAVATSQTLNLGASLAVGDLIVLLHGYDYNAASNMTTPTGTAVTTWTLRATGDAGTNFMHIKAWTGVVTSGGSGKTVIANADLGTASHMAQAVVYDGTGVTLSVDGNPVGNQGTTSTNHVFGSVTGLTVSDGELVGMAGTSPSGAGDYSVASSGLTKQTEVDASIFSTVCSFTQALASSADTVTKTVTCTANQEWATVALVVKAVSSGITGELASGTGTANQAVTGDGVTAPSLTGVGEAFFDSSTNGVSANFIGDSPVEGVGAAYDTIVGSAGEIFATTVTGIGVSFDAVISSSVESSSGSGTGSAFNAVVTSGGGVTVPPNSSVADEARILMLAELGLSEPQNLSNTDLMRLVIEDVGQTLITVTNASAASHLHRFYIQLRQD